MYCALLQDWTTLRFSGSTQSATQSELLWLDVGDIRDAIFWLEVKSVAIGGGVAVILAYETGPSKDNSTFGIMSQFPLAASTSPQITKVLEAQNPSVPLSKWVRWRIYPSGSPGSEWGATLRIHCALNVSRGL